MTAPRVIFGANHPLIEMIFLALCACISDADCRGDVKYYENATLDWLRTSFPFKSGFPLYDTLGLVFSSLDTAEFYVAIQTLA
ncbi:MAG: transposase family protein [Pirellula sp.]